MNILTGGLENNMSVAGAVVAEEDWEHWCIAWDVDASSVMGYQNGTMVTWSVDDQTWSQGGDFGTTMEVAKGSTAGADSFLSRVKLYGVKLTDQQCQDIYDDEVGFY